MLCITIADPRSPDDWFKLNASRSKNTIETRASGIKSQDYEIEIDGGV